jgi:5-methylcytosine-specific restriction endonuclease McrA
MDFKSSKPNKPGATKLTKEEMDQFVAKARQLNSERLKGYREQSLKIHPWVCARCGRHFTIKNLNMLTVHHKDHNHDNNPPDGSNWENLCVYCHDNEHGRYDNEGDGSGQMEDQTDTMTHSPFAKLADLLKDKKK